MTASRIATASDEIPSGEMENSPMGSSRYDVKYFQHQTQIVIQFSIKQILLIVGQCDCCYAVNVVAIVWTMDTDYEISYGRSKSELYFMMFTCLHSFACEMAIQLEISRR